MNDHHEVPNLRKLAEKQKQSVDSATVVHRIILPGVLGMFCAIIIGRIIPTLAQSISNEHDFSRMGQSIVARLDADFESITEVYVFGNTFLLLLFFGFILGVFIKFSFGDEQVK